MLDITLKLENLTAPELAALYCILDRQNYRDEREQVGHVLIALAGREAESEILEAEKFIGIELVH